MSYTKGPWSYHETYSNGEPNGFAITQGARFLAQVDNEIVPDDALSNARLITAAPELLSRLQISNDNIALLHSDACESRLSIELCECGLALNWRNNRAAIAKAERK